MAGMAGRDGESERGVDGAHYEGRITIVKESGPARRPRYKKPIGCHDTARLAHAILGQLTLNGNHSALYTHTCNRSPVTCPCTFPVLTARRRNSSLSVSVSSRASSRASTYTHSRPGTLGAPIFPAATPLYLPYPRDIPKWLAPQTAFPSHSSRLLFQDAP
ncbi:hypothetical protein BC827DRAFT_367702 [Russula dissimulans]|nr:hypothetical protein BC827DRAFT_367702 [Russula dissimulans]